MAPKPVQWNQPGWRRNCLRSVVGVGMLLAADSPSLGIEFSAGIRGGCEIGGLSANGSVGATVDLNSGEGDVCACACGNSGSCDVDGCNSSGDCSDVTISKATLATGAGCTDPGTTVLVLCDGNCTNPISMTVPLTADEQCALFAGELEIFLKTNLGDTVLDVDPDKGGPDPPPLPFFCPGGIPAASEWGMASLCLLTLIAGTVALRARSH